MQLLRGADIEKDQSYFLASVSGMALRQAVFPVGGMTKQAVRQLAAAAGLAPAQRRSSTGICFIGMLAHPLRCLHCTYRTCQHCEESLRGSRTELLLLATRMCVLHVFVTL